MDGYSKWAEIVEMTHTTTAKTIADLSHLFDIHGIPEQIVSDNRPQFTSSDFEEFTRIIESRIRDHRLIIQAKMVKQNGLSGLSRRV